MAGVAGCWAVFDTFKDVAEDDGAACVHQVKDTSVGQCDFCPSGGNVALHEGMMVCLGCNVVVDRVIDPGAEWRFFANGDGSSSGGGGQHKPDRTRCGMPANELLPETSMGTMIGAIGGVRRGCGFGYEPYAMRLLRKYHSWTSMPYKERTLYGVFDALTQCANKSGIPTAIVAEAKALYKSASEKGVTRGGNRQSLIASSMYVACKRANVPRSAKEVAKIFNIPAAAMTRGCKRFEERMTLPPSPTHSTQRPTRAGDFVQRFASRVGLDRGLRDVCQRVVDAVDEAGLVEENSPPSVAASCVFLVCDVKGVPGIDKKRVAEACDVSVVTILRCYRKLLPYADALVV